MKLRRRKFYSWNHIYRKALRQYRLNPTPQLHNNFQRLHFIDEHIENPAKLINGVLKYSSWALRESTLEKGDLRLACYEAILNPSQCGQSDWWEKVDVEKWWWAGKVPFNVALFQLLKNSLATFVRREGYFISRHSHQANVEKKIKQYLKGQKTTLKPFSQKIPEIAEELNISESQVRVWNSRLRQKRLSSFTSSQRNNRTPPHQAEGWRGDDSRTLWGQVENYRGRQILRGYNPTISQETEVTHRQKKELLQKPLQHARRVRGNRSAYRYKWYEFIKELLFLAKEKGKINEKDLNIAERYIGGSNQKSIARIFHLSQPTISRRINEVNGYLESGIRSLMNKGERQITNIGMQEGELEKLWETVFLN